jgi:hypothetical protein
MRNFSTKSILSFLSFVGAAALCSGACSSKTIPSGDGGGGGDGATGFVGCPLMPTSTGFVDDSTCSKVVGAWYAYGDSAGSNANVAGTDFADSDCAKGGYTIDQCSQITTPTPGQPFPPNATGAMCTSGTAAQVLMSKTATTADYSDLWGAGIGLDLNNLGGDSGVTKGVYDLSKYVGVGFDFTGTLIPTNKIRVNFPFTGEHGTDSPYWDGLTMPSSPLTTGLHVEIKWSDVAGPMYLLDQGITPPAFVDTMVSAIQFQVFTNTATSTPYNFCVNNLTLLTQL